MPGIRLFTSNRLEILAKKLAEVLSEPLASPLDREVILVQSRGMERWISMQLARHHGACANCTFPFPNAFVHEVFRKVLPDLPERPPFDPKTMTWRIMKLLPACTMSPGFESLKAYLGDAGENLKRLQLSERIADIFDQYLLFRPQMIFRWEQGHEEHWQAVLWRELAKETGKDVHRVALGKDFLKAVNASSNGIRGLPQRVSVFGISALPRFHMQIFSGIAQFTRINLFLMNPCKKYWGDIVSEWEIKRKSVREGAGDITPEELHLEKGNSLLGSMGTLGRDFFDLVYDFDCEEYEFYEEYNGNDLLSCVQSDILNLRDPQQNPDEKRAIDSNDISVRIHSCHSPMREIEVLQDQLLNMFEKDPDLRPGDILVMTPDIETYSPYIQAVFDIPSDDERRIPFSIADRGIRKESEIIDTFLAILDLKGSRFGASQVMAVIESPAVRRRFGLMEDDLDPIRRWVRETRIRWGIDVQSRIELGLPAFPENTWKAGLARLLLGYAMPGQDENMFGNVLPYDHVEGGDAQVLGRFSEFADQLFTHVTSLGRPRTLRDWAVTLAGLVEALFMPDETTEREIRVIRRMINDLETMEDLAGFDEAIDISVIKWHLGHSFEREGLGFGFITGGVTFCAMLPMRSIPFKIICLVGMNNDAYPRQSKPLGFDLMARHPEKGDRSRRDDDRYLFLEAMLSARKNLYISNVGQSIQDNSLIPPAVLVSELMDYIEQGFDIPGKNILDHIVTKHRLQAFSQEYFKKSEKLFSYSGENLEASRCTMNARKDPVPFLSRGLPEPGVEWKAIDLDDLCRFFGNPARFLLQRRLQIYLGEEESILEEREVFDIKGLEKYLLEQNLVKMRLAGRDLKDFLTPTRAGGLLPHGTVGECIFESLSQGVERFAEKTGEYIEKETLDPLEVDLFISKFRLTGRIKGIYPERLIQYRYAKVKPKDRLKVWLYHLALNSLMPDHYPCTSMLAGLEPDSKREPVCAAWEYAPVENSEKILENLMEKYWEGLMMPLHFFPESSWEYAHDLLEKEKTIEHALGSARSIWAGSHYKRGECEDACYQLCFGNTDPLDSRFQDIAEEVFGPLLRNEKGIG